MKPLITRKFCRSLREQAAKLNGEKPVRKKDCGVVNPAHPIVEGIGEYNEYYVLADTPSVFQEPTAKPF